jgi:bifunctional DNase/RNase
LTHDLIKDLLAATGNGLTEVQITEMKDGIFYAVLVFDSGVEVSARPSDSIALALRTGSRIVCAEEVLDEAGLEVPDEQEDEVEKFREFLDNVSPEDFESH